MKRKIVAGILLAISLMTTGCVGRNFVDSKYSAMEYLMDKYPSYDFVITFCEPKNNVNPYTTFNFMEKCEEGELANLFLELMQEEFAECINVTTSLSTVQGEEYGENLDLQKILSGEMTLDHDTDFYINAEGITDAEHTEIVA